MSKRRGMAGTSESGIGLPVLYDRYLVLATIGLLAMGLLMLTSASIVISNKVYGYSFHFLWRQIAHLGLGIVLALIVMRIQITFWQKMGPFFLLISVIMLFLVLVPGISHQVNGSTRWLGFGGFGFEVSELVKLVVILYLAGYLVRREQEIRSEIKGFIKPLLLLAFICLLLLKEPDFGTATVIMMTALAMMFLAGVPLWQFGLLVMLVTAALAFVAISSPYRLERLTTFLNPWASQFDGGYQLTQSLIAFGRGGWFGVGLGESVQKLFYLPEAHTDFLFAVLAEELGLIGIFLVMSLFALLVCRGLMIGERVRQQDSIFAAYVAYGLSLWIALQAIINIGVNTGVLPTKGLTLPLMSYGGSSMLVFCIAIALLLRIDYESRVASYGLRPKNPKLFHTK